ncbi:MAG: YtfJ family protein [Sulfurimonadaceae bacterium]
MKKTITLLTLAVVSLFAEVDTKQSLHPVTLEGDNGSYYTGEAWDSSMLQGKTTMLMYVDPDEKNKGEVFKPTIEAFEKDLDFDKFQILVILNLNATWKPDFVIRSLMKSKLTDYPKRTYILDTNSVLVKEWGLTDNEYNTLVINDESKVIYSHSGRWKEGEIDKINVLIRSEVK